MLYLIFVITICIIAISIVTLLAISNMSSHSTYYSGKYNTKMYGGNDVAIINKEFPYRKYSLEPYVINKLNLLLNSAPCVRSQKWSFPVGKLKQLTDYKFNLSNIVACPSIENHWLAADNVIDYYSEVARVKTPGYGEKYSIYEYWNDVNLHNRWIKNVNIKDANADRQLFREALYLNIQEPRVAYTSVNISLYSIFYDIVKKNKYYKDKFHLCTKNIRYCCIW